MSDTASRTPVTADAAAFANARGPVEAPKAQPRLRREEQKSKKEQKRLIPASSSFDLLDGEYLKNRKSRILSVVSLGVSGLVVVLLLAQLLRYQLEIQDQTNRYEVASADARKYKADLDKISTFDGVPGDIVGESLQKRSTQAAAATELELDVPKIINELSQNVPGVKLTEIKIDAPADDAKKKGEGKDENKDEKEVKYSIVTVLADVESYDAITPFLQNLRNSDSGLLSDFKETWAGEPPVLKLRIEIRVPTSSSDRYLIYANDSLTSDADAASEASATKEGGS
jgi:hypothetical protein